MSEPVTSKRGGLTDLISKKIADGIVLGQFLPGTRLDEVTLAGLYEVSRTPIREALKLLSLQVLVDCRPNRGAFVTDMSASELALMFEAIGELERLVLDLPAEDRHQVRGGLPVVGLVVPRDAVGKVDEADARTGHGLRRDVREGGRRGSRRDETGGWFLRLRESRKGGEGQREQRQRASQRAEGGDRHDSL